MTFTYILFSNTTCQECCWIFGRYSRDNAWCELENRSSTLSQAREVEFDIVGGGVQGNGIYKPRPNYWKLVKFWKMVRKLKFTYARDRTRLHPLMEAE